MPTNTIFGRIIAGEIPCNKVYEDDLVLAFHDVAPVAPVHILVVPRRPIASLLTAQPKDCSMLGTLLAKASDIGREHCPDGFRVVINNGEDGGQTVGHLHLHVLGGRPMHWPPG